MSAIARAAPHLPCERRDAKSLERRPSPSAYAAKRQCATGKFLGCVAAETARIDGCGANVADLPATRPSAATILRGTALVISFSEGLFRKLPRQADIS